MIVILEEEAFSPKGGGCLRLGQSFQKVCPTPPLLLVGTLAVLQWGRLAAGLSGSGLTCNRENWD